MKPEDSKRVDEEISGMVENMVTDLIDNLSGWDYYDDLLDRLHKVGIDVEEFSEPSGFLIQKDEVKEMMDLLISSFSQRFYFSKKDTGEI